MAKGKKTGGGSRKGSPNKTTEALRQLGDILGDAPERVAIKGLGHKNINVRIATLKIIAPYVWRKMPEQHELTGKNGEIFEIIIGRRGDDN